MAGSGLDASCVQVAVHMDWFTVASSCMSAVFVPVAERHADVLFVDVESCGHHGGVGQLLL